MNCRNEAIRCLGLLFMCIGISCNPRILAQDSSFNSKNIKSSNAELIALELKRCPSWVNVQMDDVQRRRDITAIYWRLTAYDNKTIRDGIDLYLNKQGLASSGAFDSEAKVFAFLRVVFNVPIHVAVAGKPFQVLGNPMDDATINLLWPYSTDNAGHLALTGTLEVYLGPPYDGLADFDDLASRFGRRK